MIVSKIVRKNDYIKAEETEYQGHPLINALPKIKTPGQAAKYFYKCPVITEEDRKLPPHIKRHAMMRILDTFFYPAAAHLELEHQVAEMIRYSYLSRNIKDKSYIEGLEAAKNLTEEIKKPNIVIAPPKKRRNGGSRALITYLTGCSGSGKTSVIEAILESYPQAIYHEEYQHTQLVYLKLECPHDASAKSLCINFFRAIDQALDTNYEFVYVKPRCSAENLLGSMVKVAALHSIGILVIDEIQYLYRSKSGIKEELINFFVAMTNTINISVLFVGTPKANKIFGKTMRFGRRAIQIGGTNWARLQSSGNIEEDNKDEWEDFFSDLWKLQWFTNSVPLTQEMSDLFYEYSQGIVHIAVTLFFKCQERAIVIDEEFIDYELVNLIFNEQFSIIHPMIEALRSGREESIIEFSDLDVPLEEFLGLKASPTYHENTSEIKNAIKVSKENVQPAPDKESRLISALEQAGFSSNVAILLAREAIEQHPDEDVLGLLAVVKQLQDPSAKAKKKSKRKTPKLQPKYVDKDLRMLRHNDVQKNYQILCDNGFIVNQATHG